MVMIEQDVLKLNITGTDNMRCRTEDMIVIMSMEHGLISKELKASNTLTLEQQINQATHKLLDTWLKKTHLLNKQIELQLDF